MISMEDDRSRALDALESPALRKILQDEVKTLNERLQAMPTPGPFDDVHHSMSNLLNFVSKLSLSAQAILAEIWPRNEEQARG